MSDCDICCCKLNLSTRVEIFCNKCENSFCRQCLETEIKTERQGKNCLIPCLHCGEEMDTSYLERMLPKNFWKRVVAPVMNKRNRELEFQSLPKIAEYAKWKVDLEKWNSKKQKIITLIQDAEKKYHIEKNIEVLEDLRMQKIELLRNKPIRPVITSEVKMKCQVRGCRGFLKDFKCLSCETEHCKSCHQPVTDEEHQCKESDLEMVKILKESTKNCPGCGEPTEKIDGCDQMWCVKCHVTWDWKTGREIKNLDVENIHNPEFLEWWRKSRGSNVRFDERPCDQFHRDTFFSCLNDVRKIHRSLYVKVKYIFFLFSGTDMKLSHHRNYDEVNLNLKADFINKKISKKDLEKYLDVRIKEKKLVEFMRPITTSYLRMIKDTLIDIEFIVSDFNNHHDKKYFISQVNYKVEAFIKLTRILDDYAKRSFITQEKSTRYFNYRGNSPLFEVF